MNKYTVLLDIYNEGIKACVQVNAKDVDDAKNEAFRVVYNYEPFDREDDSGDDYYACSSGFDIVIIEGHPHVIASDYNYFETCESVDS